MKLLSCYKVLKWALYTWTFFAIFFSQHTLHHTEWNLSLFSTLVYNFPGSTVRNHRSKSVTTAISDGGKV